MGNPLIVVWEPLKAGTHRKAIMICPGGAYQNIETNWRVRTDEFLQNGYVVFLLKYRTVPGWKDQEKYALFDAKRGKFVSEKNRNTTSKNGISYS